MYFKISCGIDPRRSEKECFEEIRCFVDVTSDSHLKNGDIENVLCAMHRRIHNVCCVFVYGVMILISKELDLLLLINPMEVLSDSC